MRRALERWIDGHGHFASATGGEPAPRHTAAAHTTVGSLVAAP
jgi:hypothetical protein